MLTPEDHALRRGKITGSLAAACLGLDPFCTPLGAYLRCIGEHPDDEPDEQTAAAFRRGHVLEPALVDFGAEEIAADMQCTVAIDKPGTLVHPSIPWAACSIDALYIATPGPVQLLRAGLDALVVPDPQRVTIFGAESKSVALAHASQWGEPWTDQIPRHVAVQCTWELLHYPDAEAIVLPVLIGAAMELRVYVWRRSVELELACVEALGQWHARHVVRRSPPEPGARDGDLLAAVWAASERVHPDDPRVAELCRLDCEAREHENKIGEERERLRVSLGSILRDATKCSGPWGSVTWNATRGRADVDLPLVVDDVRAQLGEPAGEVLRAAIEARMKRKPGRTMRTTWKGAR